MPDTKFSLYTLSIGENTFSSPAAQSEGDARKLQSLIPSLSGALERERPLQWLTADAPFPSQVGFFHQYKQNSSGVFTYFYFCATATTLYQLNSGKTAWNAVTLPNGNLAGYPVAININNTMRLTDGTNSYIFDGISWNVEGLAIPTHAPVFSIITPGSPLTVSSINRTNGVVTAVLTGGTGYAIPTQHLTFAGCSDASFNIEMQIVTAVGTTYTFNQPGQPNSTPGTPGTAVLSSFTVASNRYYWSTFVDQTLTHQHESSASPMSLGTGIITNQIVGLKLRPGTWSVAPGSTSVVGVGTDFDQNDVGMTCFNLGAFAPTVVSVQDAQHLTINISTALGGGPNNVVLAPARTTAINFYCSATEEDKVGSLLGTFPLNQLTNNVLDQSPFVSNQNSYITNIQRPMLNDPPNASKVIDVFKYRQFRRNEKLLNYFTFSAYEEVLAEQAGAPSESFPGVSANTASPSDVNEVSVPDQGVQITGIRKHGDALFIGTTENVTPLYGNNLSDFTLSEAQAFSVGFGGQRCTCTTPFGLAFLSWDLKVYLYPSQYSFGVDSTTALVELGRPKRPEFEQIDSTDIQNAHLVFYNWGRRNWLVFCYKRTDGTHSAWVFDFECKAWFQLQQGYTAVYVFEFTAGRKTLVGAGTDNHIYLIDDLTGNYPVVLNATYPQATLRFLLTFGDPDNFYVIKEIAFQQSNSALGTQVNLYLDPDDPDNPTSPSDPNATPSIPIPIVMSPAIRGSNLYIGRPNPSTGSTCQRALVEIIVPAGTVNGKFYGLKVEADARKLPMLAVKNI